MPETESGVIDPFERAFNIIAMSTQAAVGRMRDEITSLRGELATFRTEQRSAVITAPVVEVREGPAGKDGVPGKDGEPGKDAPPVDLDLVIREVASLVVPRVVALIPAPERGERGDAGAPGKDGEKGERGDDGLSSPEEIRSFVAEDRALQWREFFLGVWRPDAEYKRGQAVSWNGSFWIATRDTSSKPETDNSWLLAVKHGRDARK